MPSVTGFVELGADVDARLVFAGAGARIWRDDTALDGEIAIATAEDGAAVAFSIAHPTYDVERDAGQGRLTASADVETVDGISTVTALHLRRVSSGGTAWLQGTPRAILSEHQQAWHRETVMALAGVGTRPKLPGGARPRGATACTLELVGEITARSGEALASSIRRAAGQTIVLTVDSTGGNLSGGMAIYRALVAHDRRVEANISEASSAAAIAVMGCDYRRLDAHGVVLVHPPHIEAAGNARALRAQARMLDTAADDCAAILAKGCKRSMNTTKEWLNAWMTTGNDSGRQFNAASALRNGLVHEVTSEAAPASPPRIKARFAPINAPFRAIRAGRR
jgi:ATP-dependent protease ClpP protease subunit